MGGGGEGVPTYLGWGEGVPTYLGWRKGVPTMDGEGVPTYFAWGKGVPTMDGEGVPTYFAWGRREYLPWMGEGVPTLGHGVPTLDGREGIPTLEYPPPSSQETEKQSEYLLRSGRTLLFKMCFITKCVVYWSLHLGARSNRTRCKWDPV